MSRTTFFYTILSVVILLFTTCKEDTNYVSSTKADMHTVKISGAQVNVCTSPANAGSCGLYSKELLTDGKGECFFNTKEYTKPSASKINYSGIACYPIYTGEDTSLSSQSYRDGIHTGTAVILKLVPKTHITIHAMQNLTHTVYFFCVQGSGPDCGFWSASDNMAILHSKTDTTFQFNASGNNFNNYYANLSGDPDDTASIYYNKLFVPKDNKISLDINF
jgi:hypothetical protein